MTAAAPDPVVISTRFPKRRLTLFDTVCIGVNAIVGSGVFSLPDDMQRQMGGWSPLAFGLCALLLFPVALCFAELSSNTDETGGAYVYARQAFGRNVGFVVGWFCWLSTFVSWAANTTLLVELCGVTTYPLNKVVVVGIICSLGAVNYFGVKPGAWLVNAMVIGKLGAIFCFIAVAVMAFDPEPLGGALPRGVAGVGQGIYLALFPLQGFEVAPIAAGETTNARRNVPLATVGSLLFSAVLFVVVQSLLVGTYPRLGEVSWVPLLDASRYLGPTLGVIVLVGSLVSMGGFTAGSALGSPRYAHAIAAHGLLPSPVARVHPRWHTPHVAILATTSISAVLAALYDYRSLVGMTNVTVVLQYFFTCVAVPVLRRKASAAGQARAGFVIPGGALIPVLGAGGSLVLLYGADPKKDFGFGAVALVIGIGVAWLSLRQRPDSTPVT
jgi:amino acid transporter